MKLVEMKCKNCGATLEVSSDVKEAKCKYCHTTFKIDDEVKHIKYDNAEQSGYEFEKGRMRAQQESNHNEKLNTSSNEQPNKKYTFWLIMAWICFFPFMITYYIIKSDKLNTKKKAIILIVMWTLFIAIAYSNEDSNVVWSKECTDINDFDYYIDKDNIILKDYDASSDNIKICSNYTIDNKQYNVTSFSEGIFALDNVDSVILPEGLKSMPDNTFNSSNVKYVYIPKTLEKSNNNYGFYKYFSDVEKIYYGGSEEEWKTLTNNTAREDIDAKEIIYNANIDDLK